MKPDQHASTRVKLSIQSFIPTNWELKRISDVIINISNGLTYDPEIKEGFPITRIETISEGVINLEKVGHIVFRDSFGRYKLRSGDILYSHINSVAHIGKVAFVNKDMEVLHGMNLLRIIPNSNILPVFLFYFFNSEIARKQAFLTAKRAVNQASLSTLEIKAFHLPLPPLIEQISIANCLSTWDKAISATSSLISQKELRKMWLLMLLLTGKKRLPGFNGEWEKFGAGEVFKSVSVKGTLDEELLSATQDRGMIPRSMLSGRVTMPSSGTDSFKLVDKGDFVVSLRSFQGGLEYSYYKGIVSPAYTVLKPRKIINEEFFKQYFKSYDFIGHLSIAVIGIRDGKQISYDDFCAVKIPYPSIEEQTAIARVLQSADKEITLLKANLAKLKEQKKGLMQQLLTGKKRFNID
ncbi:MAG: restriction endonuclease subunit S [Bacteroidetes bacterium]|nr:restriction endonuclease subunit S [Bacteroidota bacterium]